MIGKSIVDALKLVVPAIIIWGLFAWWNPLEDKFDLEFSVDSEEQLAEMLFESDFMQYVEIQNDTVDAAIREMMNRLNMANIESPYEYKVHVVKNEQVNAYAVIAGHVFLNKGLIEFAETPEEIAAVLAHEMGHIEHRHVLRRVVKELGIAIVFGIIAGEHGELLRQLGSDLLSKAFDRSQEEDADEFAFELLTKAKLKTTHLATFFKRLKKLEFSGSEHLELFNTHPNTSSRIQKALAYEPQIEFEEEPFEFDLKEVKKIIQRNSQFNH